jgi:hypothetical protein
MAKSSKIQVKDIYRLLSKQAADKTIFCEFKAKGTGKIRKMVFQLADPNHNAGERLPIHRVLDDVQHEVLTVWDMNRQEYRRVNLPGITRLNIDQDEYTVTP